MKLSTSITLMFREFEPLERIEQAAKAGFQGVEIQVLEADPQAMAEAAKQHGVKVALLNVGMGDFLGGGPGLSGVPGREEEFRQAFDIALAAARTLDCAHIHIGPSCVPEDTERDACLEALASNIRYALGKAQQHGIELLIEPVNRPERATVLLGTTSEIVDFLESRSIQGVSVLYDIFHSVMSDEDPLQILASYKQHIAHIQFSDVPGRTPPGKGTIAFEAIWSSLEAQGYDGWLGAEYFAMADTPDTLDWMQDFA
ncbi:hydroxypyruvate isomerase family protein [Alterisphingorhabdus coralli]|uniref:TIM barrel protein n=1 Tax=Alterisphingorhabdus coralli TaxID=3071408 RepID=A0AA97I275_9SPHN|nr:TIM barrel protein [Parasphingorhabdus sp. SCSIO 66989]WOE75500.1 TIM barrel protein [Parasphingorhabdus sp. SCSIO 66989]